MEVDNDVMDRCKMETKQKQDEIAAKLNNIFMDWTRKMLEFPPNIHYKVMSLYIFKDKSSH